VVWNLFRSKPPGRTEPPTRRCFLCNAELRGPAPPDRALGEDSSEDRMCAKCVVRSRKTREELRARDARDAADPFEQFKKAHFHIGSLGSFVGDRRMVGLRYACKHCDESWAVAIPGAMYSGGASLATVRLLQNVLPLDTPFSFFTDHLKRVHSIEFPNH